MSIIAPIGNNTDHFLRYNRLPTRSQQWHAGLSTKAKQRVKHRNLQQTILQLLIAAKGHPLRLDTISYQLGYSTERTLSLLSKDSDDLWVAYQGDTSHWWTPLRHLPDRLFY